MNELRELSTPQKELNEIAIVDGSGIFSSELTRQEADDKVAALIEERSIFNETEKPGEHVEVGDVNMSKASNLKNKAEETRKKCISLDNELRRLKSRRNWEKNPAEIKKIDRQIADKESALKSAKRDFEDETRAYKDYMKKALEAEKLLRMRNALNNL